MLEEFNSNATSYNFFQAVYWLEKFLVNNNQAREKIIFSPAAELSFPASDIRRISYDQNRIKMQLNFMGLYGVDSPLPQYFFSCLAVEDDAKERIKRFLDIFNQRIYQLFYASWKKYRIHIQAEHSKCNYLNYLIAISGNSLNHIDTEELAFAGLLGSRHHTAFSLVYLLREFLKIPAIHIQEFVPVRVKLDQKLVLGQNNILGNNILLGNEMMDLTSKIQVIISCITIEDMQKFLPAQPQGQKLRLLIKRYLNSLIDFEIVFKFVADKNVLKLGETICYLGWTAVLGAEAVCHVTINSQSYNFFSEQFMPTAMTNLLHS